MPPKMSAISIFDKCYHSVVCLSLRGSPSVTLVHAAVGPNEMPFGRGTHVAFSNIILCRASVPSREGEIC